MDILVVDDFEANRALLRYLLEDEGHKVIEAEDGREAVELFVQNGADLILMDVMMPRLNGYDAALSIKSTLEANQHVPVIFLTAVTDEQALAEALRGGGDDFLTKPFNEAILMAKIKAHSRIKELNELVQNKNQELNAFKNIIDAETEIAEHVFTSALKSNYLHASHMTFYVSPASTFNGDLLLGAVGPSGSMYMIMADFTGHGLPAAIGAVPMSQHFFSLARRGVSVGDMAETLNSLLCSVLPSTMFCAATIIEQSKTGQEFTLWSGGLPNCLILDTDHNIREEIQSQHMPLSALEPYEFDRSVDVFRLRKGESMFIYTDGLTEAMSSLDEMYGEERLKDVINSMPEFVMAEVIDHLHNFLQGAKPEDDISALIVTAETLDVEAGRAMDTMPVRDCAMGWTLSLNLDVKLLKQDLSVPDQLVAMLGDQPQFARHKDYLHTIFAEFYSNALEHGILGLSSTLKDTEDGYIDYYMLRAERLQKLQAATLDIQLQLIPGEPGKLLIIFQDSGAGFNYQDIKPGSEDDSYGRGILLIQRLTEKLEYSVGGTRVEAIYPLDNVSEDAKSSSNSIFAA